MTNVNAMGVLYDAFSYAVVVNLVPLLTGRGFALAAAAVIFGLGGVGEVAGRPPTRSGTGDCRSGPARC